MGFHSCRCLIRLWKLTKRFPKPIDHFLVPKIPCSADDDSAGLIVLFQKLINLISREGLDQLRGSENWKTEWMVSPTGPIENVVDIIIRRILHHLNLLEDNHPLLLHIFHVHEGMKENIGQEIDGQRQILIDHLGIKTGVFPSGKGIESSTDRVDLFGNVESGSPFCPFKEEMFNEMRYPVFTGLFISGPGGQPNAEGD
jgi:hypothetical protein